MISLCCFLSFSHALLILTYTVCGGGCSILLKLWPVEFFCRTSKSLIPFLSSEFHKHDLRGVPLHGEDEEWSWCSGRACSHMNMATVHYWTNSSPHSFPLYYYSICIVKLHDWSRNSADGLWLHVTSMNCWYTHFLNLNGLMGRMSQLRVLWAH